MFAGMGDSFKTLVGDVIQGNWFAITDDMLKIWGNFTTGMVAMIGEAGKQVVKLWAETAASMARGLYLYGKEEGGMGAAARFMLGSDPRKNEAELEQVNRDIRLIESGATKFESTDTGEDITAQKLEDLKRQRDRLQKVAEGRPMAEAGAFSGIDFQFEAWSANAQKWIDKNTKPPPQAAAAGEGEVRALTPFEEEMYGAKGEFRNRQMALLDAEQAAWEAQQWADEAIASLGPAGAGVASPIGARGTAMVSTFSAAAAQAAGQMGATGPQNRMIAAIEEQRDIAAETRDAMIAAKDATIEASRATVQWLTSLVYG